MNYNYMKLSAKIVEKCGTQGVFSSMMGLSERTISLKLNNLVPWKQTEISKAVEILDIPLEEIQLYFFTQTVQEI